MTDLQCPARVRLVTAPVDERVGLRLAPADGADPRLLVDELDGLVDSCRGELIQVVADETTVRSVTELLLGRARTAPVLLETDSDGWRLAAVDM